MNNLKNELDFKIIEKEIEDLLKSFITIGAGEEGGGLTRLLYTKEWLEAQEVLEKIIKSYGFEAKYDEIGNLFAVFKSKDEKAKTIMTGSHLDTVISGGLYDGLYGILAGILAMHILKKTYGEPKLNLEAVAFAEEEGSRFPYIYWGSKNLVSNLNKEDVKDLKDANEIRFEDAMQSAGFNFKDEASHARNDIEKFVELHIEQGSILETENLSIGIVKAIVGQKRLTIEVCGQANHAGTTPMKYRKDAVRIASKMIDNLLEKTDEYGEPLVLTVGRIDVLPNVVNVVANKVSFTIDLRHPDEKIIEEFSNEIYRIKEEFQEKYETKINIDTWMDEEPSLMNEDIQKIIEEVCIKEGLDYKYMYSGAGHDSQVLSQHVDTAMIFVPSVKGISHSPEEFTEPKDLARGVIILAKTLYRLAY